MTYFLSFILAWLCGMLAILVFAFYTYDQFSIIDIASFAVFTFAGFLILFLVIYLFVLRIINKKIGGKKQFVYFPLIFSVLANLPVYFIIWKNTPALYGRGEANLFTMGFITCGLIFGLFWAWKNKLQGAGKTS
jgi:hypothetical protein